MLKEIKNLLGIELSEEVKEQEKSSEELDEEDDEILVSHDY